MFDCVQKGGWERGAEGDRTLNVYYAEFMKILFKQAHDAVETGKEYVAIKKLRMSNGTLKAWAFGDGAYGRGPHEK